MNIYAFFDISPENLPRAKVKSTALTVAPVAMGAFYFVILFQGLTVINWFKKLIIIKKIKITGYFLFTTLAIKLKAKNA